MEDDIINKEIIKALLYFSDNSIQKYSYLKDYIDETDFCCILTDLNNLLKKTKLSEKDKLVLKWIKQGRTHEEIAQALDITRSAVTHRLDRIVDKLHETA